MQRSKKLTLTLMLGTAGFALAGCQDDPETQARSYASYEACVSDGTYTRAACNEAFDQARAEHQQSAPRYEDRALCEAEFGPGQCESGGGSSFVPFMAGYFVADVLDDIGDAAKKKRYAKPYYRTSGGDWLTSSGAVLSKGANGVSLSRSQATAPPKPSTLFTKTTVRSTGGFGSAGRSSFGG